MSKDQATKFDVLYRRVIDRCKTTEVLFKQLLQRSEAEERYTEQLERISATMQSGGGDIDDLVKGVKVDLNQRSQYCKQFTNSFRHDLEQSLIDVKVIMQSIEPLAQDLSRLDKEIKIAYEKYDRQKEKTNKSAREYEEAAITLEATLWNKESTNEQKTKCLHKLQQQLQFKQENESTFKFAATHYNSLLNHLQQALLNGTTQLQVVFTNVFALAKDMVMKTLVYEISKTRNLQYDSEQFFKEAEKYDDPQPDGTVPGPSSQLGFVAIRQNLQKVNQSIPTSFLRNLADGISISHKLNVKKDVTITSTAEIEPTLAMLQNEALITDLKGQAIHLIQKVNNKHKQKDVEGNPLDRDPTVESVINKYKQIYPEEQLKELFSFIKYSVQQSQVEPVKNWKNVSIDNVQYGEYLNKKIYRELGCIVLESYRQAGCSSIQIGAYKQLVSYTQKLLEVSQKEGELSIVKRTIIMIATIYWLDEHDKRMFLQDGLQSMNIWRQMDLWDGLIYVTIEEEMAKLPKQDGQPINKEQILKDKNTVYSNLLSLIMNMISFKVDKQETKNIIIRYGRVFQLYELQVQELLSFVENDGKIDVNRQINSLSVLQTLYNGPSIEQSKGQGQLVAKRVLIFDKRKDPLGVPIQQKPQSVQSPMFSQLQSTTTTQQTQQQIQQQQLQQQQQQQQQQIQQTSPLLQQQKATQSPTTDYKKSGSFDMEYNGEEKKPTYNQHPLEPKSTFLKKLQ